MGENAKKLSKPYATADISRILISELEKDDDFSNSLSVATLIKYKTRYLFIKNDDKLNLLEGALNLNETPISALNRLAQSILDISLEKLSKVSFESILDEHGNQTIYLNYKSEINSIETNPNIVLLSKDNIKNYQFSASAEALLKELKLL